MIKTAFIYRITSPITVNLSDLGESLQAQAFTACGSTQEKSVGWIAPRGEEHGAFIESVGGHWILQLMTEVKKVPAGAIKDKVTTQCNEIESLTGRKPGKKERRDIAEEVRLTLLPFAFPARHTTTVWIDPTAKTLVLDAGSQGKADDVLAALIKVVEGISIQLVSTKTSPASAMATWLVTKESPSTFGVDRECELKATDESKAVVKYGRHALDIDEVVVHIQQGKMPTKLALTWNSRVSFVLTDGLQLKKISFLDVIFENKSDLAADGFDADVAIMTGELSKLIPDLVEALGGDAEAPQ